VVRGLHQLAEGPRYQPPPVHQYTVSKQSGEVRLPPLMPVDGAGGCKEMMGNRSICSIR